MADTIHSHKQAQQELVRLADRCADKMEAVFDAAAVTPLLDWIEQHADVSPEEMLAKLPDAFAAMELRPDGKRFEQAVASALMQGMAVAAVAATPAVIPEAEDLTMEDLLNDEQQTTM